MTAPSRINVKGETLSVYWRNEADADWGYKALRNAGHPALVEHELTMAAPATERTAAGIHMQNNIPGVDYGATMRLLGAPHEIVQYTQQLIAQEQARGALGNLGITGDGQHIAAGASVSTTIANGAAQDASQGARL